MTINPVLIVMGANVAFGAFGMSDDESLRMIASVAFFLECIATIAWTVATIMSQAQ